MSDFRLLTAGALSAATEKTKMRSPNLSSLLAVLLALPWLPAAGSAQETPRLAVDVSAGSARAEPLDPRELVIFQGTLFFVGESPLTGRELFRTDATVEGTRVVADICSGRCSSDPATLFVAGDHLFFRACDPARGCKLWSSDGTARGTLALGEDPVRLPWVASFHFAVWNGQAAYVTAEGELYLSDGTVEGTRFLADVKPDPTPSPVAVAIAAGPSKIYVLLRQELWVSDGEGAERILELPQGLLSGPLLAVGDQLFFGQSGEEPALWASDGTAAGTRLVQRTEATPSLRFAVGERAYFVARSTLYTSDGTAAGTQTVAGVPPTETSHGFSGVAHHFGQSYFVRREESYGIAPKSGLWRLNADGTGAAPVAELDGWLTAVSAGDSLYLATGRPNRLYRSFGPAWSVTLVREWADSDSLGELTPGGGRHLVFRVGADLGTSDGTGEGTDRLQLLWNPPSADPVGLASCSSLLGRFGEGA